MLFLIIKIFFYFQKTFLILINNIAKSIIPIKIAIKIKTNF